MITITYNKGGSILVEAGSKTFTVFTEQGDTSIKADQHLFFHPEEAPAPGTVSWPGEYDFTDFSLRGIAHEEGKDISFVAQIDDVRCAFLSAPLHGFSDYEIEQLGEVNALFIAGDDAKLVQKMVDEIDPSILILLPHREHTSAFADVLKACGAQGQEVVESYKIKSLPTEGREIVVLG